MMLLQIYFEVPAGKESAFETMYAESYVPAMKKQTGYQGSKLLKLFAPDVIKEIQARETPFNFQMELIFDTEENRRKWAGSPEHQEVWPLAQGLAKQVAWRGYDVVGTDLFR